MNLLAKFFKIPRYVIRNAIYPRILTQIYHGVLKKNLGLKDKHNGKRCFIISGGPSARNLDFQLFKNELVIVLGEFDKHMRANEIIPTYHVLGDTDYFSQGPDHYLTRQFINKQSAINLKTNIIINATGKDFVEKNHLFLKHNINYVLTYGIMNEYFGFNIDPTKTLPWPKNTVLLCIILAVYMGFKEIYLLGCEHSFLTQTIRLGRSLIYDHAYDEGRADFGQTTDPEVAKKYFVQKDFTKNYEDNVAHVHQLFKNYRLLKNKLAREKPEVKIFNATPNSFLDVFPFIKFEEIDWPHH